MKLLYYDNMDADISNLVIFKGNDAEEISRMKRAMQWIANTPEGLAKLKEAKALHHTPLKIINLSSNPYPGYYPNNTIFLNTHLVEAMHYVNEHGEARPYSLERFLAHELLHATQPSVPGEMVNYQAKVAEIGWQIGTHFIPMEEYRNQIKAVCYDDAKLRSIFGKIFDKYVSPNTPNIRKATLNALTMDESITEFWTKYETPAVEFENLMMGKYKHEPCHSTDYSLGDPSMTLDYALTCRDDFIETNLGSIKAANERQASRQAENAKVGSAKKHPSIGRQQKSQPFAHK